MLRKHSTDCDLFLLIASFTLYFLNNTIKNEIKISFIKTILQCHFNDFLAGIAILAYINYVLQHSKYSSFLFDTPTAVVCVTFFCGIAWEYVFPHIYPKGTSDWIDVIAYMIGGSAYAYIIHLPVWNRKKKKFFGEQ